jgi:hypothetical protein
LTQLEGSPVREHLADHSDTSYRCAGRLHDAFDWNMWSSSTKFSAYDQ